ncbi:MAG TPA: hypothetical protein VFM98_02665 [Ramlibacter sp.]|uniref:hypothetical protein n=1 Tax=Ramlibacter sp. TaxID=1917967 RepID=UPI002D806DC6|nr:hypothetical protein [Ramlibacter sp.]HET8744479.1 hypothetical protein [Ramlibacter sp.]
MTRFLSARPLLAATIAVGAFAVGSAAHARTDVFLNIGVPSPYVQPAPVYVQPAPVYVQPERVYVQPQPVYVQPRPIYIDGHRHGRHDHHRHGVRGDADRDGVPNRFDRAPHNPWRR